MTKTPKDSLLEKERFELKPKSGGGLLSYEVWGYRVKGETIITRYNLAYINQACTAGITDGFLGSTMPMTTITGISWARLRLLNLKVTRQRWSGSSRNGCR